MKTVTLKLKPAVVPQTPKSRNAKDWPTEYVCNFIEPGLVSYEDVKAGIAMLRKEAILKMLPSFVGKPVISRIHKDVTPKDFKEHAVGYVTRAWYDDYTNWAMCAFILIDDKTKEDVAKGYSVSCSYDVLETAKGGEWHAIKYNEEIIDGYLTHLAIVLSPRYEDCRVVMNSKNATITPLSNKKPKGVKMLGFLKKLLKKDNATEFDPEHVLVEVGKDKKKVSVAELLKLHNAKKLVNAKSAEELEQVDLAEEIEDADGEKIKIADLVSLYNSDEEEKEKKEKADKDAKENEKCTCDAKDGEEHKGDCKMNKKASKKNEKTAEELAKEKADQDAADLKIKADNDKAAADAAADKEKKDNDKGPKKVNHFVKLNAAKNVGEAVTGVAVDMLSDRIQRGNEKYGSSKKK